MKRWLVNFRLTFDYFHIIGLAMNHALITSTELCLCIAEYIMKHVSITVEQTLDPTVFQDWINGCHSEQVTYCPPRTAVLPLIANDKHHYIIGIVTGWTKWKCHFRQ